ncbi:peroxidase 4-like [Prunus avium]|uniref:Peroxidase n=1 Tax=Prunus avium TaxID=42229 RepID=A0A6P5S7T1_PRUAV|nr:peroxidase 4-like [Prunus avium]
MASRRSSSLCSIWVIVLLLGFTGSSSAHLSKHFYSKSCPKVFDAVKSVVQSAVNNEKRMGASLLRLHFHDCFVNGCDGSLLLDDTSSFTGEKTAGPNNNSLRGFEVVDKIKSQLEKICHGVVSCADILAIAARDSVKILGGPSWKVKLGRRDSKTANFTAADSGALPAPTANLSQLKTTFRAVGLNKRDLVALSGAHTIGKARCSSFKDRIYNETNIDASFAKARQSKCPITVGSGDNNLAPLDVQTPGTFDIAYFKNLINQKGLLHSDQVLYNNGGSTASLVKKYSGSANTFNSHFAKAMIKMGNNKPLTGSNGEIRLNCRRSN